MKPSISGWCSTLILCCSFLKNGHPGCWCFAHHQQPSTASCPHNILVLLRGKVLLTEEILHLLVSSLSHHLQRFISGAGVLPSTAWESTKLFWRPFFNYPVILRILGLWRAPHLMGKIHHPWLLTSPNITGFFTIWPSRYLDTDGSGDCQPKRANHHND